MRNCRVMRLISSKRSQAAVDGQRSYRSGKSAKSRRRWIRNGLTHRHIRPILHSGFIFRRGGFFCGFIVRLKKYINTIFRRGGFFCGLCLPNTSCGGFFCCNISCRSRLFARFCLSNIPSGVDDRPSSSAVVITLDFRPAPGLWPPIS
jgi:hypothetical protein